jgi:hypothetical protein
MDVRRIGCQAPADAGGRDCWPRNFRLENYRRFVAGVLMSEVCTCQHCTALKLLSCFRVWSFYWVRICSEWGSRFCRVVFEPTPPLVGDVPPRHDREIMGCCAEDDCLTDCTSCQQDTDRLTDHYNPFALHCDVQEQEEGQIDRA